MIHGTYDNETRNFSLKAGREELFVIHVGLDGTLVLNFVTKQMGRGMCLFGSVIVQVTDSFEHGRIELFY